MKVLFLSPVASLGGAERVLLSLLTELRSCQPPVATQVLTLGEGPLNVALADCGIAASVVPLPGSLERLGDSQVSLGNGLGRKVLLLAQALLGLPGLAQVVRRLRRTVRSCRPDLIHSNGIKTHLLARLAGIDTIPTLWHVHDFYGSRALAARLLRWASGRMQGAIAISQTVADDFRRVVPGRPVAVIPNAIDVERFRPRLLNPGRLDQLAGLPSAPPGTSRIGMVATYARWKGHDVFLQAAAELVRKGCRPPPVST